MAEFTRTKISLLLILLLHLTAVTGQDVPSFYVRDGAEVTLSCYSLISQDKCEYTTWNVNHVNGTSTEELINHGRIAPNEFAQAKAARLSVTANCSLVIKKVTAEDVGRYVCQQFISNTKQGSDAAVYLFLVKMTEQKEIDQLKFHCSVSTYGRCEQRVTWLCGEERLDQNSSNIQISQRLCKTTVTLLKNHCDKDKLKCQVFHVSGKVQTFDFNCLTSAGPYIAAGVGSAALLIIAVVFIVCYKRAKGKKTSTDDSVGLTLVSDADRAVKQPDPAGSQDEDDDPVDGLTYASISHPDKNKKTGKSKVRHTDDDDDGVVTYATVKPSSAPAGASADPSDLYATVNKPAK